MEKYDFSGWATRNDIKCSDGRTIRKNAFIHNDGQEVPLVWNHQHNDAYNVLGHALLENREEGVYAYCTFNDTESGKNAKLLVQHGDVKALSIYANKLKQKGSDVLHGAIREVSLVLAGANPGAYIDSVLAHGEDIDSMSDEELAEALEHSDAAIIYSGEDIELYHAESKTKENDKMENEPEKKFKEKTGNGKTIQEVFDTFTPEQKDVVYAIVGAAVEDATAGSDKKDSEGGKDDMKHNAFDNEDIREENTLSHADQMAIIKDAKNHGGSVRDSFLAHAGDYGIDNIDYLFPEAKALNETPEFIKREMGWVSKVINGTKHTPFSRIKSVFADITEDEARAKGYIKGKLKKEEVFSLLKRSTSPTTIYKKQKMDRDDVVDITSFDVIAWLKGEMRLMLDEEIARAVLIGDGRLTSDDDHIDENCIRPIWKEADLYAVKRLLTIAANEANDEDAIAKKFMRDVIKSRKEYKGSGNPSLYTTEDMVTNCLLLEDGIGHRLYKTVDELATALRVKEIITVPVMEGATREVQGKTHTLLALMVNLSDYAIGADKGGAVNMFDDFDIDYNQMKYLIETRCSGALIKPFSAIVFESTPAA